MAASATAASAAPPDTSALVSLDEIRAAARVLRGVAVRTPLLPADDLSARLGGGTIFLKPEMLQRGGAFKFRGAYTFLAGLSPEARARGVIAPSSGNHAQAVAFAARIFGVHATLVMPTTVTAAKRAGVERLGGRVELAGTTTADRMERAQQLAKESGSVLVPPYDDARIIAGQGTAGLEIVEDLPDVGTVLVPVGGGGLSAGVATAVKLLVPSARVIGVEPVGAAKLTRARAAGAPVRLDSTGGMADGLLATQIGTIPFAHHAAYIDEVVTVEDAELAPAMRYLLDRLKIVTEPSGAITVAALQSGRVEPRGNTVAFLSGGNIEWDGLRSVLGER
ncbi:MAG: Threonine dehydratase, catabolic [Gemmatimonadetes bacterium]|nr:Threonine dehydratase, catabolic [Gemmatimonadota bacterium]